MFCRSRILFAANDFALAWTLHACAVRAQDSASGCQLTKEAQLPLVERSRRFLVEAEINGQKRLFVVDSGAWKSALSPDVADALNLPVDRTGAQRVSGVGQTITPEYPRVVASIRLGGEQWTDLRLPVTGQRTFTSFGEPNLAGILGADILSRYDVELDFPAQTMTLYTARNCLGRFAPWRGDYQAYSPDYTPHHTFLMDMALDGHAIRAVLDTGAGASLVSSDAALRAGIDGAVLARDRVGSGQGVSGASFETYVHRFSTVQIGKRIFRNTNMLIGNTFFPRGIDMLLGMDFLKWRRVWLSYSTGWVFMQWSGPSGSPDTKALRADEAPPVSATSLDAARQLQMVGSAGVGWAGLPPGPITQFSSHSHITYRMIPHIVEVPRLSPQAIPQSPMPVPMQ